ncbi:hypothetical protein QK292_16280 [Arthrobacter sp. AL08]|uniref:hypothetical protein n=1 Tax=unclassified Arthrobacter TaxID=235627 RepID=UPI001CFF6533|nr:MULTISPECIES: hypothetical protein [unclassified Arthrobacter]MCB5283161.1 hypothetical protein [Arthrobacter sp. ES1]MDI3243137.1 hypothetical protein [Arthrobacter sp. AL05]MDI3279123.1 hypothetical protein [Arthrobacter sp. AL08]WGZ80933.1 hypothetical protein QI450_07130 [Arthrobacter sp. EM1]
MPRDEVEALLGNLDRALALAMCSGFGIRTLDTGNEGYWPLRDDAGSVWSHDTVVILQGTARAGHGAKPRRSPQRGRGLRRSIHCVPGTSCSQRQLTTGCRCVPGGVVDSESHGAFGLLVLCGHESRCVSRSERQAIALKFNGESVTRAFG